MLMMCLKILIPFSIINLIFSLNLLVCPVQTTYFFPIQVFSVQSVTFWLSLNVIMTKIQFHLN